MAEQTDIYNFHKGEGLHFTAALKNRDGSPLMSPASQTVTLRISETAGGTSAIALDSAPQVSLTDAGNSVWTIEANPTDLASLTEGVMYYYNVWSVLTGQSPILQLQGALRMRESIE